jgi:hypothetical protein
MLNTIVGIICWIWAVEVAASLLMYAWAVCQRSRRQTRTWPCEAAERLEQEAA